MSKFKTKRIDGEASLPDWEKLKKAINHAAAKHEYAIIEVRAYDPEKEISDQQMKFWHAVPIKAFSERTGYSLWKSEIWLKRECGEQYFMQPLREEETRRGQIMFECMNPNCRDLFAVPKRIEHGVYVCPSRECMSENIRLFFMLSKTELKTREFNEVLQNTCDFMGSINCPIQMPDPNWRLSKQECLK